MTTSLELLDSFSEYSFSCRTKLQTVSLIFKGNFLRTQSGEGLRSIGGIFCLVACRCTKSQWISVLVATCFAWKRFANRDCESRLLLQHVCSLKIDGEYVAAIQSMIYE
ncbi:uncharacterized protein LOC143182044 [Calliopsis andreniformis]|uniref:uncharacterized protein LOC143182044 n=1 Tax=Calliopsis andreniformis TaxID=337506 RepID=UPI003FCE35CE